jgi:hypothetical protein
MFDIQTGTEHGVTWTVDTKTKVDPIIITVKSDKGEKTVEHRCSHRPIFGYDGDDLNDVEEILDKLIKEYATE